MPQPAMMTGSGSALFGLFRAREEVSRAIQSLGGEVEVFPISLVGRARSIDPLWWQAARRTCRNENDGRPKAGTCDDPDRLKVFTGNANPALAEEICQCLGMELGRAMVSQFSDGEIYLQIQENVRGADVFVIQPTCTPVDRNLMELLLMIDALKRASAERITAVLPYYGYARQDRKDKPRVPISAKLVAKHCWKRRAPTGFWRSICTPRRSRGSSIFRWTTCSRRR